MKIEGYGITLEVPAAWHGRVYRRSPQYAISVEAATMPLPPVADNALEATQRSMKRGDVYILLNDIGGPAPRPVDGWELASLPVGITREDIFFPVESIQLPAWAMRSLVINGRPIMLGVGFASPPSDSTIDQVNNVLETLTISGDSSRN